MKMRSVSVEDRQLSFYESGHGVPILLIHGYPLNHRMWLPLIEAAEGAPIRWIAPDLRGFGDSTMGGASEYSLVSLARDLHELIRQLALKRVVVAGLSMGGYIALEYWRQFSAEVSAIIFCDTRASADSDEAQTIREQAAIRVIHEGTAAVVDPMLERLISPWTREHNPELVTSLQTMMRSTAPTTIAAAQKAMAYRRDFTGDLGAIHSPTLLLVGEHDVLTPPAEMKTMEKSLRQVRFAQIANVGHLAPWEAPQETLGAIRSFLTSFENG